MYTLLIAIAATLATLGGITLAMGLKVAIAPALMVGLGVFGAISWRNSQKIGPELQLAMAVMADESIEPPQRLAATRAALEAMKARWANWQFMVANQLDAQIGMLDYMTKGFDAAYPRLERGSWRNWSALVCLGAIDFRRGKKDDAWKRFEKAVEAGPKEVWAYLPYVVLLEKSDRREQALVVLEKGLKELPGQKDMVALRDVISNKRKIDVHSFGQQWYMFFPEDLQQAYLEQQLVKGRKGGPALPFKVPGGPSTPKPMNRQQRRSQK